MRSPRYSTMRVPLRIVRVAYTPRPWMPESRVSTGGGSKGSASFCADERALPRTFLRLRFVDMQRLDGDRRLDAGVRLIVQELEVLELILEDRRRLAFDRQARQRQRSALQLLVGLLEMVQVQVAATAGPDEVAGGQIALLREHVRQQGVGSDVERHAEEHFGAALVELA